MSDLVGTPAQVAQQLETCEAKIWELINSGRLPHVRLGERKVVIPWRLLDQWLADQAHAATVLDDLHPDKAAS
jgi:excisionase family DNA binding protein